MLPVILPIIAVLSFASDGIFKKTGTCYVNSYINAVVKQINWKTQNKGKKKINVFIYRLFQLASLLLGYHKNGETKLVKWNKENTLCQLLLSIKTIKTL